MNIKFFVISMLVSLSVIVGQWLGDSYLLSLAIAIFASLAAAFIGRRLLNKQVDLAKGMASEAENALKQEMLKVLPMM